MTNKYILSIAFVFAALLLAGQSLDVSSISISEDITADEKEQMITILQERWDNFVSSANLGSEAGRDVFLKLFDFDAELYVDFKETPMDMRLNINDYVDEAATRFPNGMVFKLEQPVLTNLDIGADYNFSAEIVYTKKYDEFLDMDRIMKYQEGGLVSEQRIIFSIDPYELEKTYIMEVQGRFIPTQILAENDVSKKERKRKREKEKSKEEDNSEEELSEESEKEEEAADERDALAENPPKEQREKRRKNKKTYKAPKEKVTFKSVESMFSATLGASLGSGKLKTTSDVTLLKDEGVDFNFLGVPALELSYRRSIGSAQRLFLRVGAGMGLGKLKTDISSFAHGADSNGYTDSQTFIANSARSNNGPGSDILEIVGDDPINASRVLVLGNPDNNNISKGVETIALYDFHLYPGVSFKIFESGSSLSRLFLDAGADIMFISGSGSNNVSYTGSISEGAGLKLPNSDLFPRDYVIDNLEEFRNIDAYRADTEDIAELRGSSMSNLSFAADLGLTFQRKIDFGFGLEIGVNYRYGLTPLFSEGSGTGFLESDINETGNPSIVEAYYSDSTLNRLSFKVGLYFLLDKD